nr:hypothetical protein [Tanacetum cinerariifolium]
QPATDESPKVEEQTILEPLSNINPENKAHYDVEKEAIYLILTGIGDDIYSTVDACKTAYDMRITIERLQHGESLKKQDVKTSLFWEFGRFTSRDGESDDVLPVEEQPLPAAVSPTADSPGYILESESEEDLEEDNEDREEDPTNYPTDREDDKDEEDEPSRDDADDEDRDEDEEEEEEEHPALTGSVPPHVHHVTARMSVRAQTPISLPSETEVAKLLAIPTLPPSLLSSLSSPLP